MEKSTESWVAQTLPLVPWVCWLARGLWSQWILDALVNTLKTDICRRSRTYTEQQRSELEQIRFIWTSHNVPNQLEPLLNASTVNFSLQVWRPSTGWLENHDFFLWRSDGLAQGLTGWYPHFCTYFWNWYNNRARWCRAWLESYDSSGNYASTVDLQRILRWGE